MPTRQMDVSRGTRPYESRSIVTPVIRRAESSDIEGISTIHEKSLRGLLAELGGAAIRAYYSGRIASTTSAGPGVVLVATTSDGRVLGLLDLDGGGSGLLAGLPRFKRWRIGAAALRRPRSTLRVLRRASEGFAVPSADAAFIRFFAVDPVERGYGVGALLLAQAAHEAETLKCRVLETATSNPRLIDHYLKRRSGEVVRTWSGTGGRSVLVRLPLPLTNERPASERSEPS